MNNVKGSDFMNHTKVPEVSVPYATRPGPQRAGISRLGLVRGWPRGDEPPETSGGSRRCRRR